MSMWTKVLHVTMAEKSVRASVVAGFTPIVSVITPVVVKWGNHHAAPSDDAEYRLREQAVKAPLRRRIPSPNR